MVLHDVDLDLDGLFGGLHHGVDVSHRDLGRRQLVRPVLRVVVGRIDGVHEADRNIAGHGLVDGPQRGAQRRVRSVDTDDDRGRQP